MALEIRGFSMRDDLTIYIKLVQNLHPVFIVYIGLFTIRSFAIQI